MSQATHKPPEPETPVEAFRFAADFTPGEVGENGTVPFTAIARTANVVNHWYWGPCVHDFAGKTSKPVITVDWSHLDDEALGFVNNQTVSEAGLQCAGFLTPFREKDRASEIVFKASVGVPYETSIYFDPWSCVVEDVPAGFTTEVNGKTYEGPVAVFRQWELKRLAICLSGVDGETSVGFSQKLSGKTVAVTRFKKGDDMATKPAAAKNAGKFAEGETDDKEKKDEAAAEGSPEEEASESTAEAEAEGDTTTKKEDEDETKLSRKQLGQKFITAFGVTHGPALFAKGCTFSEASQEYTKILITENKALHDQVTKLSKGTVPNGATPASFGVAGNPQPKSKFAHLGNIGRLAAGIKMPK
jgi:hypothetical protein